MNPRRLYRCRQDRMLAGVAGGMAEYLEVDPTVVRILWLLSFFLGGFGILLYILMAFIVPLEPVTAPMPAPAATDGPAGAPGAEGVVPDDATRTGWTAPAAGPTAWTTPAHTTWAAPVHQPRPDDGRGGRGAIVFGTLLVVFGGIALVGVLLPGWASAALLGPAFVLALGIALLASAVRRPATGS